MHFSGGKYELSKFFKICSYEDTKMDGHNSNKEDVGGKGEENGRGGAVTRRKMVRSSKTRTR
jgi:hypothetical protein